MNESSFERLTKKKLSEPLIISPKIKKEGKKINQSNQNITSYKKIYDKGVEMLKSREKTYDNYQKSKAEDYKKYPYKPDLSYTNKSNNSSRSVSPSNKSSVSVYEAQRLWVKKKENKINALEKHLQFETKKLCPFHPKINRTEIEDDEEFILKHIDKMNEYVSGRKKFIRVQKEREKRRVAKNLLLS